MITRRVVLQGALKGAALFAAGGVGCTSYAVAEPWRTLVTRYRVTPAGWPEGLALKLAVVTDLHVCEPWMGLDRVRQIVARTNALGADVVLLLGDYRAGGKLRQLSRPVADAAWAGALAGLSAPLGVHAILGNHDWWDDRDAMRRRGGPTTARRALEAAGIPVYENDAVRLQKAGEPFWLAGLGDQWAFYLDRRRIRRTRPQDGVHDLPATLARITDDAPVIMMAHEPDIFADMPARVALTLSGHTHGGQVRLMGYAPVVPSAYGRRYLHGHVVEDGRHLIVSAGLGCSGAPVRFGVPPEIVLIELGGAAGAEV